MNGLSLYLLAVVGILPRRIAPLFSRGSDGSTILKPPSKPSPGADGEGRGFHPGEGKREGA